MEKLLVLLLFVSVQAHAALVVSAQNVTDTRTGLSWLNLDQTIGQSFDAISQRLNTDLSGYRRAELAELHSLFGESGGFYYGAPPVFVVDGFEVPPPDTPQRLAKHAEFAAAFNGFSFNGEESLVGFSKTVYAGFGPAGFGSGFRPSLLPLLYVDDIAPLSYSRGSDHIGSWLVLSPIPEPSTWILMLVGLLYVYWCAPMSMVVPVLRAVRK